VRKVRSAACCRSAEANNSNNEKNEREENMKRFIVLCLALWAGVSGVRADEGMWLLPYLQKLNIKDMKARGFRLSAEDIYDVNRYAIKDAVVIFGGGCTGEVVSDRGLVLTNHHCGFGAIQQHSTVERDYLKNGFWAMSDREEIPTPGLTVTFIRRIEDVSDRILSQLDDSLSEQDRTVKVVQAIAMVKSQTKLDRPGQEVEIKDFFGGNQYLLFVKEVYTDVRLVGAPPSSIGKFGGDTDNWMWPRHTGDFSIFRIYASPDGAPADYSEENVPYRPPVHLPVSVKGYKPGDFTMIIGFPGSTERYKTSYEIDYTLDVANPNRIFIRGERQKLMMEDMLASDRVRIQYASKYSSSSNYWKNSIGENRGLKRQRVRERKLAEEEKFTEWANADPERRAKYGEALPLIRKAVEGSAPLRDRLQYFSEALIRGTEIIGAVGAAIPLINAEKQVDTSRIGEIAGKLQAFYKDYNPPTDRKIAKRMFGLLLDSLSAEELPSCFAVIRENFGGDADAYIDYVYDNSLFASPEKAEKFLRRPDANAFLNDPAYKMRREVVKTYNALVDSIRAFDSVFYRGHRLYVAGLMAMNPDKKYYPDANFTMRLSYGQVLPYEPQDAVYYDYFTTLDGVIAKEDPQNAYEFAVPDKLKELYRERDYGPYAEKGVLPVNFITTNDITGGNSGSPVMNRKGELIGLAFDGNWEAMSGDTVFEPRLQRTICVDIRYVLFIIDRFAGDTRLIDEMTIVR